MYSDYGPLFDALGDSGFSPSQVDGLRAIFTQCMAELEHRNQVIISGNRELGATDAMLLVENLPFAPNDNRTQVPTNGWAIDVNGPVRFNGPVHGPLKWGKATSDWTNTGTAAWVSYVTVAVVDDASGTESSPRKTVQVYLPRSSTRDPNVRTGDIVAFWMDGNERAYCASEVFDGKIGEIRDLGLGDNPASYPKRGWDLADGTGGTDNLSGDNSHLYGYTGAGVFTGTAGTTAIASAFTAALSGSGTATTSTGGSHSHDISDSEITAQIVVTTPVLSHSGSGTVTTAGHEHDITLTMTEAAGTGTDVVRMVQGSSTGTVSTDSATDSITGSAIAAAISNHAATACTVTTTGGGGIQTDNQGSHSHTVSIADVAAGLSIGTPSTNRPAGKLVNRIQRVS